MEKRVTTLEVLSAQQTKSIDRLEQSIVHLRTEVNGSLATLSTELRGEIQHLSDRVDRKFFWVVGVQIGTLITMLGAMAKLAQLF